MEPKGTRDERYEAFKRQVEWDGWSGVTRGVFDDLFPEKDGQVNALKPTAKEGVS